MSETIGPALRQAIHKTAHSRCSAVARQFYWRPFLDALRWVRQPTQFMYRGHVSTFRRWRRQVFAAIEMRRRATHFVRRDDGPRYVIYGARAKTPPFPRELTPARGRSYIDGFAQVAPSMHCRTDDVADAYEFLLQAALRAGDHVRRRLVRRDQPRREHAHLPGRNIGWPTTISLAG